MAQRRSMIETVSARNSKGTALKFLMNRFDLATAEMLVVCSGVDDIPLLKLTQQKVGIDIGASSCKKLSFTIQYEHILASV
ncbi:hypothetical protein [Lacticaseibacillus paracasei]|uniref:hypothetical protein n=1 Tax=Lacticaseibacillus paracasei TaxID=1597 RepID=UPI0039FC3941